MNREDLVERITATASLNLEMIIDTLTTVVMEMIEEAKKMGIYKQERKKWLNLLMNEVKLHQNMMDRKAGEKIGEVADYNEAFSEQILEARMKSLEEARKVLEEYGIPNVNYLAHLHQARVIGLAAYSAVKIWTRKMEVASSPLPCKNTVEPFRPEKIMNRMQQLITYEFLKYQGKDDHSEEAKKADWEFVGKMADTKMICDIMEGRIKPSWMMEEEANKTATEAV